MHTDMYVVRNAKKSLKENLCDDGYQIINAINDFDTNRRSPDKAFDDLMNAVNNLAKEHFLPQCVALKLDRLPPYEPESTSVFALIDSDASG